MSYMSDEESIECKEGGQCRLCGKQFDRIDSFMKHECREYVTSVIKEAFVPLKETMLGFKFESNIKEEKLHTIHRGKVIMMPLDFYDEAETIPEGTPFSEFDNYKSVDNLKNRSGNMVLNTIWQK